MQEEARQDRLQGTPGAEGDVGRHLRLVHHPATGAVAGLGEEAEVRVHVPGQGVEEAPLEPGGRLVSQALGEAPACAGNDGLQVAGVARPWRQGT